MTKDLNFEDFAVAGTRGSTINMVVILNGENTENKMVGNTDPVVLTKVTNDGIYMEVNTNLEELKPIKPELEDTPEAAVVKMEKIPTKPEVLSPIKTCLALSVTFHLVYSAANGIQNLQSSINHSQGLGVATLATLYGMVLFVGPFGPPALRMFGAKNILLTAWVSNLTYIGANFFPAFYTLIPTAAFLGVMGSFVATASVLYTTAISDSYIAQKGLAPERRHGVLSVVNGVFYTFWESTQFTGNLLSSLILFLISGAAPVEEAPTDPSLCGANMCEGPTSGVNATVAAQPQRETIYILLGVFLACIVLGCLVTIVALPDLPIAPALNERSPWQEAASCYKMFLDARCIMLVPLFMSQAMLLMILFTGLTSAFISCALGLKWVGFVMMAYGTSIAIFATAANSLACYLSRQVLIVTFILIDMGILLTLILWQPGEGNTKVILFSIAAIAGVSEGISQPQFNALLSTVFKEDLGPAFVAYTMVKWLSIAVSLLIAAFACLYVRLYIALIAYALGFLGYMTAEMKIYRKKPLKDGIKV